MIRLIRIEYLKHRCHVLSRRARKARGLAALGLLAELGSASMALYRLRYPDAIQPAW